MTLFRDAEFMYQRNKYTHGPNLAFASANVDEYPQLLLSSIDKSTLPKAVVIA